jgi:hypothetical protein
MKYINEITNGTSGLESIKSEIMLHMYDGMQQGITVSYSAIFGLKSGSGDWLIQVGFS